MRDIYAILCDEIAGTSKNCRNLQKLWFDEKEKINKNYVKSYFLLLAMISEHTTSQKVLGIFKFSSCFISDLNKHMTQTYKTLMSQTRCSFTKGICNNLCKMNK